MTVRGSKQTKSPTSMPSARTSSADFTARRARPRSFQMCAAFHRRSRSRGSTHCKLQGAAVSPPEKRVNAAVLRFAVFGAQAADRRDRDAAVRLDFVEIMPPSCSRARISTSGRSAAIKVENAALSCSFRSVAECCQFTDKIVRRFIRKAGRRIDESRL